MRGVVIIGAGLAGLRCATSLRSLGYEGPVTLIGDEPVMPYERPALSKQLLSGERVGTDLEIASDASLEEQGIAMRTGVSVHAINMEEHRVELNTGEQIAWDDLVIATGSRARELETLASFENAQTLRTLADADQLRSSITPGMNLTILGCGFVGAEVAGTACKLGANVTIVEPAEVPFERTLGPQVGALLYEAYTEEGIRVACRTGMTNAITDHLSPTRLSAIELTDGSTLPTDVLLVSIGAIPNDEIFHAAWGTEQPGRGIPVNHVGASPVPHVYACGDVARVPHPHIQDGVRLEHWTDASTTAVTVARTILGLEPLPRMAPYVWSDQLGHRLQVVGTTHAARETIIHDAEIGSLLAEYVDEHGNTVAWLGINRSRKVAGWRKSLVVPTRAPVEAAESHAVSVAS